MATIAGLRGTGDWSTDERPKNFRETILFLDPNGETPLTGLLSKMGSESTDDPEFSWWEEALEQTRLKVNGSHNSSVTTVAVEAETLPLRGALSLVAGDVLQYEGSTGLLELLFVTSNPTVDTSIPVVTRGFAGSTAATIPDDAILLKIGTAFSEGSFAPKSVTKNPTKKTNYAQIFKTAYDITETAKKTYARTGPALKNDKKRRMFDHSVALEMAFLFGRSSEIVGTNGKPLRTTGGLNTFLTTNRTVFSTSNFDGGGIDTFLDAISPLFNRRGEGAGNERICFLGNSALNTINKAVKANGSTRINFEGTVKTYGMDLHKLVIPQGNLYLKSHPLFNTNPVYSKSIFVLNPRGIIYRYLRDTQEQNNIQANDEDVERGQWLTECGLEVHHESTMGYFGNVA